MHDRRLGGCAEAAAETPAAAWATAAWAAARAPAAAAAEHPERARVGVALVLHDSLDLRLDRREFIVAGAQGLLDPVHHPLLPLGRIKPPTAAASSTPTATTAASTAASSADLA
ncbi:MAG: hypothetical protein ABSH08_02600 [Tepidisphaeraceae bacterium]